MLKFNALSRRGYITRREKLRWDKITAQTIGETEAFLKAREIRCVPACSKFLNRQGSREHIWSLRNEGGGIFALLFYSGRTLFPVFDYPELIPAPSFMNRFLKKIPIHALHGCRKDTDIVEYALAELGCRCSDQIDYDLMSLDGEPNSEAQKNAPVGLVLRQPDISDMDALYLLQAAYEKEEVLPRGIAFNGALCRRSLEHIISGEHILAAELDGHIVGKINTNALSFSRYQIGGVYVHPDYRGRGIAVAMGAAFARFLTGRGWGLSLFVKKRNTTARAVYRRIGFTVVEDYRISYY
jgi:ribosomal protein S18 acetylase RimI-like enzyme